MCFVCGYACLSANISLQSHGQTSNFLNKNIESKSHQHFVQRLLVPSVRQQVAKPQVLMRSAELFKVGGETVLDRMHRICVAIWETGEWPEEWTFSTFILLPKKGDLKH